MATKVDRNVTFGAPEIDETFDEFKADMYYPSSASSKKAPLKMRPFVFIDGEGVNHYGPDNPQSYVLIGASTGERLKGFDLSTVELFEFLIGLKVAHPNGLFVGFGLQYDVNMWVKDMPEKRVDERIRKSKRTQWGKYTIMYMPKKIFMLTDREKKVTITITDVMTFFANKTFAEACAEYLVNDTEAMAVIEEVREGKKGRDTFQYEELDTIIEPYMSKELVLGVQLMDRQRQYLFNAGIRPMGWHGPGAIASALIRREGIRDCMRKPDKHILEWSRRAYFGGHFEQFFTGFYEGPVYQNDVNSAYTYALTFVPNLATGRWVFRRYPTNTGSQFKIYALRYRNNTIGMTGWNPLPHRSKSHTIHYQGWTEGYYWGPEAEIVLRDYSDYVEVLGVYEFEDDGERPFDFLNEMYETRREWKAAGNPAQGSLKTGYSSIYGKLAQRVGWDEKTKMSPKSHNLEWAGFATSFCRSMILDAMTQSPDTVVAVETDSIFSTKPLDLKIGTGLGEFDSEILTGIVYIQNGVYFKRDGDKWLPGKTRGFSKNRLDIEVVMDHLEDLKPLTTTSRRFNGMSTINSGKWRTWEDYETHVQWGGTGKRVHRDDICKGCQDGTHWHQTSWVSAPGVKSQPHTLPWIDGFSNTFQMHEDDILEGLLAS